MLSSELFDELLAEPDPASTKRSTGNPSKLDTIDPFDERLAGFDAVGSPLDKAFEDLNKPKNEFRYACKVCGTTLFATEDQVGSMTRCPDCYSEFSIPRPIVKPKPVGRPSAAMPASDEIALREAVASGDLSDPTAKNAADLLRRAQVELAEEKAKNLYETYDFDAQSAATRTFGFLRDPGVYPVTLGPGFILGLVLIAADYVWNLGGQEDNRLYEVGTLLILAGVGGPILLGCLLNGLAVLQAAANNERTVSDWPAFNIFENLGEVFMLGVAFVLAAVPGGVLGWAAINLLDMGQMMGVALSLLSAWLLFPAVLLGMMDTQSIFSPISGEVVDSIRLRPNAWGVMYTLTGLSSFVVFLMILAMLELSAGGVVKIVCAMFLPLVIFFAFHQMGNLASQIATVTSLGFGDDEEDEDDAV